jgi:hypothetical protein
MEITITKKITLPAYYKTVAHQFKIISQEHCVCVTLVKNGQGLQIMHANLPFDIDAERSTESEFNYAFTKVSNEIQNLI